MVFGISKVFSALLMKLCTYDSLPSSITDRKSDNGSQLAFANVEWKDAAHSSSLEPFEYSPLNTAAGGKHIRLLFLQPGVYHDDIRCRLSHSSLSQNPNYEALSYCWGPSEFNYAIVIEDEDRNERGRFSITKNLHLALKRLRHTSVERTLWVDAVCINQEDEEEKTVQVSFMRHIYENAKNTMVWLGAASGNSDEALALVSTINHVATVTNPDIEALGEGTRFNMWDLEGDRKGLPKAHDKIWYDLFEILKRDWFYRSWIVQELAVSHKVTILCGNTESEWKPFIQAIIFLVKSGGFALTLGMNGLQQLLNLDAQRGQFQDRERTEGQAEVIHVLLQNRKAFTTNPSDHLFAFHGFFEPGSVGHSLTLPNYKKNCKSVFTDFATQLLESHQNLDIFSITRTREGRGNVELYGLLSWVPDWSAGDLSESFLWRQFCPDFPPDQKPCYKASGDSSYDLVLDETERKLTVEGWIISEVNTTAAVLEQSSDRVEIYDIDKMARCIIYDQRVLSSWETVSRGYDTFTSYPTGEKMMEAYWKTLLGGCLYGNPDHMRSSFDLWFLKTRKHRVLSIFRLDQAWFLKLYIWIRGFISYILALFCVPMSKHLQVNPAVFEFPKLATHMGYRRMMRTDQGLIGLAPPLAKPGDKIVLCKGGKLPLILRPKLSDWELIGDCYIHGIMDGELWNMLEGRATRAGPIWDLHRMGSSKKKFVLV